MKIWQEDRWPHQWLGECDSTWTVDKNHASIRCNSESDAIDFMTKNECCPAIDEKAEDRNRLEQRITNLRKALSDEAAKSSCLFAEAVEWKRIAIDATNTDTKLIRERDAAVKHSELGMEINGNLRNEIDRQVERVEEAKLALAIERLITDRQYEEIIRLKAKIIAAGIDEARIRFSAAPTDDSWLNP